MELNVEITGNDMFTLHNNRGYQKGKVVEKIVCSAMEQLGMPFINYTEVNMWMYITTIYKAIWLNSINKEKAQDIH